MKPEIINRLDSLTMGKIPAGYKLTKMGIAPNDWQEIDLAQAGSFFKGKGINKSQLMPRGKACIHYGELYTSAEVVLDKFQSFISEATAHYSTQVIKGDILLASSGETAKDIGKTAAYMGDEEAYVGGDIIILRQNGINPVYLAHLLNDPLVNRQRYQLAQSYSIFHLYIEKIKNISLVLPSLEEQDKIADP